MSRILKNVIASFGGAVSAAVLNLVFTIAYFRILDGESYGLVIFCTTILIFGNAIVEAGIARTTTRELARREHAPELAQEMHDVLFTLQIMHFALALACALAIVGLSHWLASDWLQRDKLNIDDAVRAIILVGGIAILQFPRALCQAALAGLQRQVFLNICTAAFVLLRGVATIAALHWLGPNATIFLVVQLIVSGMETTTLFIATWQRMPKARRHARFDMRHVREVWAFTAGDTVGILVSIAMGIGDRVLLSRLLPLEAFGVYGLAVQMADAVQRVVNPFVGAYFPHFIDLLARKDHDQLSHDYHRITIVVAALMLPAVFLICFFSAEILQLVSGKPSVVQDFAPVLAVRALATAFNTLQWFPHAMQLATGLSSFSLVVNIFSASIYLPGILFLTPVYGVIVPPALWLLVTVLQVIPMIVVTHRRALMGEAWTWVEGSLLRPTLVAFGIVVVSRYFAPTTVSWLVTVPWLGATYLVAIAAVLSASRRTRPLLTALWSRSYWRYGTKVIAKDGT